MHLAVKTWYFSQAVSYSQITHKFKFVRNKQRAFYIVSNRTPDLITVVIRSSHIIQSTPLQSYNVHIIRIWNDVGF